MALIQDLFYISYSNKDNTFTIHTPEKDIHFVRSRRGIYYHDCSPGQLVITIVQTVEGNIEGFKNRQVISSSQARCAYDMVGRPSPHDFERMVRDNMILNFPITVSDIKNAHTIFGTNVGSILRKIVGTNTEPVEFDYITILLIIMEQNSELELTGDIFLLKIFLFL